MHCDENVERLGRQLTAAKDNLAMHKRLGDVVGEEYVKLEQRVLDLNELYRKAWFKWLALQP